MTRDIYHLVFDRYGSVDALEIGLGIDNRGFMSWLEAHDFHVIEGARANYLKTYQSLASTLNMKHLVDLFAGSDPATFAGYADLIGDNAVGRFLQSRGYTYHHVGSWYYATWASEIAEHSYDYGTPVDFASTLVANSVLPSIIDGIIDSYDRHAGSAEFQFDVLNSLAATPTDDPRYIFAHILLPHPPFVFLADGSFAPGEATFQSQLQFVNAQIGRLVEPLLELPGDEQPIIILQADEGPYPSRFAMDDRGFDWAEATDDELITKYGVLNAMFLPGPEGSQPPRAGPTLVNTYPEILGRYFGLQAGYERDRSFTSPNGPALDLTDVTDRLDAAQG